MLPVTPETFDIYVHKLALLTFPVTHRLLNSSVFITSRRRHGY